MAKGIRTIWIDSDSVGVLGTKVYRDGFLIATLPFGTLEYKDPTALEGVEYKYVTQAYTATSESTDETLGVNMDYYTISGSVPVDLKPIMTGFRVTSANPNRVLFDTPLGPVTGISATDFTISGKTISSVNTVDNYFTISTSLNYWDNNTIRKEGGNNDVVYDFTMERIDNNISVPTIAPANYRYVSEDGSDSANGLTEGTAWLTLKHALQTTPSGGGYQIWVKVGTYLNENIVQADMDNGSEGAPYRITGYKSTIGDITSNYYTLTPNTAYPALDDTEMPLFDGGDSSTGRFIYNDSRNYYIWENLQVTGYAEAFRSRFSNVQGQQVINSNVKDMGVIGSNYGYGVYWVNETVTANRNRILGSNFINCESNATQIDGEHSLTKGCKVYSNVGTTGSEGTDYYYATSGSNNIYLDNLAYNDGNGGHNGHGFSAKTGGDGLAVHYNLYDNCEAVAIQGAFQARHANCKFNVWKNSIARADIPNRKEGSSDNYTGCIDFQSGGDQNVFENLTCHDTHQFIRFNLNGESDTDPDIQTNALIKNCLVYDVKNVIDANSVIAGVSAPNGNKLANCTIKGADNMFWQWAGTGSVEFGLNKIENCIIENVPTLNKDEVVVGWTYSYNDFWNTFTTPSGTGNFEVDPDLDASYQPQATFTDIDVPKINNVFYGKNGVERQDPTTVGSVLSASEIPSEPPVTDFDFYVSATGTGDGLTEGSPMSFADSQTTINSMTNGQSIGYKGGDEFFGSLSVAGRTGITIGSYGTGKAIIKGSQPISDLEWSTSGGNIWTASTGSDTAYQVFKSGNPITMGRFPKIASSNNPLASYYANTGASVGSYTSIPSSAATGLDLNGSTANISSRKWVLESRTVQSYNSGTGGFSWSGNTTYTIENGTRFFVNNKLSLCTTQDEWFYSGGTLYIYSVDQPTDISISTVDGDGITISNSSYLNFDNIEVFGFSNHGIPITTSNDITINNCKLDSNYYSAILATTIPNLVITNNDITNSSRNAIYITGVSPDSIITGNNVTDIGLMKTITNRAIYQTNAIENDGTDATITDNTVSNVGYIAIYWKGARSLLEKNYVSNYCSTLDDGAGIYSWNNDYNSPGPEDSIVRLNTIESFEFIGLWYSNGFYTDERVHDVLCQGNTIINGYFGIYLHNNKNMDIDSNNVYNAASYAIHLKEDANGGEGEMTGNNVHGNQFFMIVSDSEPAFYRSQYTVSAVGLFGTYDYNYYYNPYYANLNSVILGNPTSQFMTLTQWQAASLQDANSVENNSLWTSDEQSQIVYNYSDTQSVKPLSGTWYGLDGTTYVGSITLQAFKSEILIQN